MRFVCRASLRRFATCLADAGAPASSGAVVRSSARERPTLKKYATIGGVLTTRRGGDWADDVASGVEFVASLVTELHIPRLTAFGVTMDRVAEMVALARKASSMRYNPVVLSDDGLADVVRRAL